MNLNVPPAYQINPNCAHTTKTTINRYQRSFATQSLIDCILAESIQDANCWGAELLASGFHAILWETLIALYFKSINYSHPMLIDYLHQQYLLYNEVKKSYTGNLKKLCNNQELRNHLAETIGLLCMAEKNEFKIPVKPIRYDIDESVQEKANKFVSIFIKNISVTSVLYHQFSQLVLNYYNDCLDNCLHFLNWFVKDNDYAVDVTVDFKTPALLNRKSILLIYKFLILQIKTQIKMNNMSDKTEVITDLLDTVISYYILFYKKQDYETCTYIVLYILILSRCLETFDQIESINTSEQQLVRQTLMINVLYQKIQQTATEKAAKAATGKGGKKSEEEKMVDFNELNKEYIRLINDVTLLVPDIDLGNKENEEESDNEGMKDNEDTEDDETDDEGPDDYDEVTEDEEEDDEDDEEDNEEGDEDNEDDDEDDDEGEVLCGKNKNYMVRMV